MRATKDKVDKERARKAPIPSGESLQAGYRKRVQGFLRDLANDRTVSIEDVKRISDILQYDPVTAAKIDLEKARQMFLSKASDYVQLHLNATRGAYAAMEFDVAARHAEWAITRMGAGQVRVIEQIAEQGPGQGNIVIGVQVGGQKEAQVIDLDADRSR